MADVQLEDGYVRIANSLFEALYRAGLSGSELAVMMAMIRLTWGFGRKSDRISAGILARETGLSRPRCHALMIRLERLGMLANEGKCTRKKVLWWVVKDFDEWRKLSRNGKTDETTQTVSPSKTGCLDRQDRSVSTGKTLQRQKTVKKEKGASRPLSTLPEITDSWCADFIAPEGNKTGRPIPIHRFRIWLAWAWHTQGMREKHYTARGFKRGVKRWWSNLDRFRRDGDPTDLARAEQWFERLCAHAEREARPPEDHSSSPPLSEHLRSAAEELFA